MLKSNLKTGLYFIAEFGQNHQGDINIAKQMVDSLIGSGVSAIKTAKRDIDTCMSEKQKNMIYDNLNSFGKTYYEHRKALELSNCEFVEFKNYAESKGFDFISSFTDENSLRFLIDIGVKYLKIASQRITDIPLLEKANELFDGTIIMSSGMSTLEDVYNMVNIFRNQKYKYLLQCTSVYPCPEEYININVLQTYKEMVSLLVDGFGLSGHHSSIAPDIAVWLKGFPIIERHYTLNRSWKGTDHSASLGIDGIKYIIKFTNQIYDALGSYEKEILDAELPAINKLRQDLKK